MGRTTQVLGRWVREFAAGVDAGNAIRHGRPVRARALRGSVRDAADLPRPSRHVPTSRGRA